MLARVGSAEITEAALDHWADVQTGLTGVPADRHDVLGHLIALNRVAGEAAEYGVHVSETEARKGLELLRFERDSSVDLELAAEEPELRRLLASSRLSDADRVWLVRTEMLALRLRRRLLAGAQERTSERQVANYYNAHRELFMAPERRDIEIFLTNDLASAERGKREVIHGKSFKAVAKLRNVSAEGGRDGLVMGLARGAGEPAFEKHVFTARTHVLLGPIRQVLFYVFRVSKVTPAHPLALREVDERIRRRLVPPSIIGSLSKEVDRRWIAKTTCSQRYRVAQCGVAKGRA